jgi:hypothetical protein
MTMTEINTLAMYNSEIARGIQHREDWTRQMVALQTKFDAERTQASINGTVMVVTVNDRP